MSEALEGSHARLLERLSVGAHFDGRTHYEFPPGITRRQACIFLLSLDFYELAGPEALEWLRQKMGLVFAEE